MGWADINADVGGKNKEGDSQPVPATWLKWMLCYMRDHAKDFPPGTPLSKVQDVVDWILADGKLADKRLTMNQSCGPVIDNERPRDFFLRTTRLGSLMTAVKPIVKEEYFDKMYANATAQRIAKIYNHWIDSWRKAWPDVALAYHGKSDMFIITNIQKNDRMGTFSGDRVEEVRDFFAEQPTAVGYVIGQLRAKEKPKHVKLLDYTPYLLREHEKDAECCVFPVDWFAVSPKLKEQSGPYATITRASKDNKKQNPANICRNAVPLTGELREKFVRPVKAMLQYYHDVPSRVGERWRK